MGCNEKEDGREKNIEDGRGMESLNSDRSREVNRMKKEIEDSERIWLKRKRGVGGG